MSKPRFLTKEEIKDILNSFPLPAGLLPIQQEYALKQIKQVYKSELKKIEIVPEGLNSLRDQLVSLFQKSVIKPGESVGIWSAASQSRLIFQSTLDAFHKAGQAGGKGAATALQRLTELYKFQKNPKNDACDVHFEEKMTYEKIFLEKRPELISVSIDDLMKRSGLEYEIEYTNVFFIDEQLPDWYHIYCEIYDLPLPEIVKDVKFLRLKFKPEILLEYKVTMFDIFETINNHFPRLFVCYFSSEDRGIFDIWPILQSIEECVPNDVKNMNLRMIADKTDITLETAIFTCFHDVLIPKLDSFIIKGIKGIKDLTPVEKNIWQIIQGDVPRFKNRAVNIQKLYINRNFIVSGILWSEVIFMFKEFGIKILDHKEDEWIILESPDKKKSIFEVMNEKITLEQSTNKKFEDENKIKNKKFVKNYAGPGTLTYAYKHFYAETDGTNLQEILSKPGVSTKGTISNNPTEVSKVFGIDAAATVLMKEIFSVLKFSPTSTPINYRHIKLISDFTIFYGILLPHDSRGVSLQNRNTLSIASFEKQFDTIYNAGLMGKKELLNDVSSGIMVNKKLKIGVGAYDTEDEYTEGLTITEFKNKMRENDITADNTSDAIRDLGLRKYYQDPTSFLVHAGDDDDAILDSEEREYNEEQGDYSFDPSLEQDSYNQRAAPTILDSEDVEFASQSNKEIDIPRVPVSSFAINQLLQNVTKDIPLVIDDRTVPPFGRRNRELEYSKNYISGALTDKAPTETQECKENIIPEKIPAINVDRRKIDKTIEEGKNFIQRDTNKISKAEIENDMRKQSGGSVFAASDTVDIGIKTSGPVFPTPAKPRIGKFAKFDLDAIPEI